MMREYPALVITDARDLRKNGRNPPFAHLNLCPGNNSSLFEYYKGNMAHMNVDMALRKGDMALMEQGSNLATSDHPRRPTIWEGEVQFH